MRIKRLDLKAFGPFTDKVLNFNCETPGLHIIFGANEAGKSSALRALKVLLYGFPQRTTDNFNHPNNQLLVGGCLEEAHGKQLTFYRRKKRKADIVDSQGNPLEADISDRFLQGIEFSVFESLYGIDHKTLVQGGKDILDQKGEVGQALFSAGAGITSLKDIQDSLDKEAENLFKPRGSTQKISLTLKKYKDFKKQVKEKSLHSGKWKEHNQRLNEARIQQKQLEQEKNRIAAELERLKRLKRVIPQMARLENLQNQLRDFGDVVILPEQFQKNNQKLDLDIQNTQSLLDHNRERQKKLDETIRAVVVNQPILDHAEAIEDLHQRLGEYRKGLKDRSRLDGMRIARRKDAGAYLEAVRPDLTLKEVDVLKPVLNRKRTIQELSTRYESMVQRKSDLGRHIDDAVKEIEIITETLSRLPEVKESKELVNSIKLTRKQGDIDGLIEELSRDISGTQSACQSKLNRLGLWPGKLDDLPGLNLPMGETIRRFETDFNKIENTKNQYKKEQEKLKTELKAALTSAREVEYSGDIPTEHTLNLARQKRQKGWDLLLRQWVNKEDVSAEAEKYEKGSLLHLAYEKQVVISDHIADRMRREADRIAKAAALKARIESLEQALLEISLHKKTADNQKIKKQEAWQALWKPSGISPLLPEEMLAWLMDMDRLRSKVIELSHKKQAIAKHKEVRLKHCTILVNELKKLDRVNTLSEKELIAPALAAAESALEDIQNTRAKYNKLMESRTRAAKTLEKLEKELKKAETLDAEWHENWEKALKGLGLTQKILPSEGMDIFDTLDNCFTKLKEANEFQSRIKGIDRDTEKFIADINALVHKTAPELKELSPDQAVLHLRDMLVKARQNRDSLETSRKEKEEIDLEIKKTEKKQQALNNQMNDLLATAKCSTPTDLTLAVSKSDKYQQLKEKISNTRADLAELSDGMSLEMIKHQAGEVEMDKLPGEIESLVHRIDKELDPQIKALSQIIGEEKRELEHMDGSAEAADAAEEMEQTAAKTKRLVNQYIEIKLAAKVLKQEIERYREEHQDPVLKKASVFFSRLTLKSFAELRTDMDDNGNPILVGIRPDNPRESVKVEGMSEGTCDQLYLALRLATLEWRLKTCQPIPFIVDDILINFDDERSRATLKCLAGLSEKNQVILFTHHQQIASCAEKIGSNKSIQIHNL